MRGNGNRSRPDEPQGFISGLFLVGCDLFVLLSLLFGAVIVGSRFLGWSDASIVMLGQSALPVALLPVWFALAVTVFRSHPVRGGMALLLCVFHIFSIRPALGRDEVPQWAASAKTLRVVSSNALNANGDPGYGTGIAKLNADVLVFAEFSTLVERGLRNAGALDQYQFEARDSLEYTNVAVFSKFAFDRPPRLVPLTYPGTELVVVDVLVGGQTVRVVGVHPASGLGIDYRAFVETMQLLREEVRQTPYPIVVAGDFNGSRWVPAVGELFGAGLTSSHEALGYGLSASWPEGMRISRFMRIDHVLYGNGLAALKVQDPLLPGTDHRAIAVDLAIRPR